MNAVLTIDETRDLVRRRGWLCQVPQRFQRAVLDRCILEHIRADTAVFVVGDPPKGMFGLVAGSVGVSLAQEKRGPYLAHFARPGTWFGEEAAFTGRAQHVCLTATRDTDLLHLPLSAFQEIVDEDPSAWRLFALVTIGHLNLAIGASDDLMIRDHVKRFIAILLRLGGCRLATQPNSVPVDIDINQEHLAAMTNLARTTAGSILRKLEAAGHLDLSYRRIRIRAPDALRNLLSD
jgi:CRP/FNR family cyclic AMP-dependent transcriptional regulator